MPREDDFRPTPGFQGSETSSAEVTIYTQSGDPIQAGGGPVLTTGRRRADEESSLLAVNANNQIGTPAGDWSCTLKDGRGNNERLMSRILDDDWVDIILSRHARRWHVMRGLVGSRRRSRVVDSKGTTSEAITLTGKGFGTIWEKTPIWFNPFVGENVSGAVSRQVFGGATNVIGNPTKAIQGFLKGFLEELAGLGRATWLMPKEIPNLVSDRFIENVLFEVDNYKDDPPRTGISQNYLMPQGTLWSLAKEWSDPMFNEMYTDMLIDGKPQPQGVETDINDAKMSVIFRDRPFPTLKDGASSPWFDLPLYIVPRETLGNSDVGYSGMERYNAFFIAPQLATEALKVNAIEVMAPLWSPSDILRHGLRRFDIVSKYTSPTADVFTLTQDLRERVRDWYMINPYLLSGTLSLKMGMPDIRIGTRIRVPGAASELDDETYYVEGVGHSWSLLPGIRTSLTVTRGWKGTDSTLLEAMQTIAEEYEAPPRAVPEDVAFA